MGRAKMRKPAPAINVQVGWDPILHGADIGAPDWDLLLTLNSGRDPPSHSHIGLIGLARSAAIRSRWVGENRGQKPATMAFQLCRDSDGIDLDGMNTPAIAPSSRCLPPAPCRPAGEPASSMSTRGAPRLFAIRPTRIERRQQPSPGLRVAASAFHGVK